MNDEDRVIDGEIDDLPYPMAQVVGEKTSLTMRSPFVRSEHWDVEHTGLEVHLDGGYNPLIVQGTIDDEGNRATVGTWVSPEATREFGEALLEAADRVERAREENQEPTQEKSSLLERAKQSVLSRGKDNE